jgi:hypothetical protein
MKTCEMQTRETYRNMPTSNPPRARKAAEGFFRRWSFATNPPECKLFFDEMDLFEKSRP